MFTAFGDLKYGDEAALQEWMAAHDLKHQSYAQAMGRQGVNLPVLLVPASITDQWTEDHANQHAVLYQQFTSTSNSSINDISTNPTQDKDTFYNWMQIHDTLHQFLDQAFGFSGT